MGDAQKITVVARRSDIGAQKQLVFCQFASFSQIAIYTFPSLGACRHNRHKLLITNSLLHYQASEKAKISCLEKNHELSVKSPLSDPKTGLTPPSTDPRA